MKSTPQQSSIASAVEYSVRHYFSLLDGEQSTDLYQLIINEVERPLLSVVLEQTGGNQSKASMILGLNRGTLRKKLLQHNLLD